MSMKEQWQQLAGELNLEFKEGIDALLESPHLASIVATEMTGKPVDIQQVSTMLNTPFVRGMLSKIFLGMITGTHRGFELFIYRGTTSSSSSSNTRSYQVNVALFFKKPYELGLKVTPANFFSKLGKMLFASSYVRIPGSKLDPMVVIKADNKEQTQIMFSYEALQDKLLDLFSGSGDIKISDHGIRIKESGEILPKQRIMELLDLIAAAAEKFY
ncbi:MAG: hypothetical protein GY757_09050 [bacterium]|nr:hypothetical protein [bacterium]